MIKRYFILFFFFCLPFIGISQAILTDLSSNNVLNQYWKAHSTSRSARTQAGSADTLILPFFDDFSKGGVFPNQALWLDSNVFINSNYPINPPSIGVATFDGVNKFGNPYVATNPSAYGVADTLTSKLINLFNYINTTDQTVHLYQPSDSVYMSFFYEAQGRGNQPESEDSLIVQFRTPGKPWRNVFGIKGNRSDTTFTQVFIPITDTTYMKRGFQFRFKNYATLSGNLDHWHVDYIRIDKNRSLANKYFADVAFIERPLAMTSPYQTMPYSHYAASSKVSSYNIKLFNNNDPSSSALVLYQLSMFDKNNAFVDSTPSTYLNGFSPQIVYNSSRPFPFNFNNPTSSDSVSFKLVHRIKTSPDINSSNDTCIYFQKFNNSFAYDDGSAENGFGLNVSQSKLAYKFTLSHPDTLRGVQMFFTQLINNVSQYTFKIVVWSSLSPENIVYTSADVNPNYNNSINGVYAYHIDSSLVVLPAGDFYVGWIQNTDQLLNVGFDRNTSSESNIHYNVTGSWQTFNVPGSLMIRPMVGHKLPANYFGVNELTKHKISVFPNPTSDKVYIDGGGDHLTVSIYNTLGSLVKTIQGKEISVSEIPTGLYLIVITDSLTGEKYSRKLSIEHD